jgi:hypothetical protein
LISKIESDCVGLRKILPDLEIPLLRVSRSGKSWVINDDRFGTAIIHAAGIEVRRFVNPSGLLVFLTGKVSTPMEFHLAVARTGPSALTIQSVPCAGHPLG